MTLPSKSISKAFFANWKQPSANLSEGKVEINIDGEKKDLSEFDFSEASTAISLPKLGKRSKNFEEENQVSFDDEDFGSLLEQELEFLPMTSMPKLARAPKVFAESNKRICKS